MVPKDWFQFEGFHSQGERTLRKTGMFFPDNRI
jgi:hypothetical protein